MFSRPVSSGWNPVPTSRSEPTRPRSRADPLGRLGDPAEDLQERRLAGAVAADDADHLARLDLEGDVPRAPRSPRPRPGPRRSPGAGGASSRTRRRPPRGSEPAVAGPAELVPLADACRRRWPGGSWAGSRVGGEGGRAGDGRAAAGGGLRRCRRSGRSVLRKKKRPKTSRAAVEAVEIASDRRVPGRPQDRRPVGVDDPEHRVQRPPAYWTGRGSTSGRVDHRADVHQDLHARTGSRTGGRDRGPSAPPAIRPSPSVAANVRTTSSGSASRPQPGADRRRTAAAPRTAPGDRHVDQEAADRGRRDEQPGEVDLRQQVLLGDQAQARRRSTALEKNVQGTRPAKTNSG